MRTHVCNCGFVLDRDWNAAINILKLALSTTGHVGTWVDASTSLSVRLSADSELVELHAEVIHPNASGDSTSTLAGAILSRQVGSMNEESSPF
jgi:putative transposase